VANDASYESLAQTDQSSKYPTITPESLQKIIHTPDEKYLLVDIRPRDQYLLAHIPNALSYPGDTITSLDLSGVQKLLIVSDPTEGLQNETITTYLAKNNVPFAFLEGGQVAWEKKNEQVVTTGDPSSFVDQSKITYVTPGDLKKRLQEGENIFLLDVQEREQFKQSHLQGAINIPLSELETRVHEVPSGQKVAVYGHTDHDAFQAGITLFDLNIFSAQVISGQDILTGTSGLFVEKQ
jgi:rhodanese-related sulfurtransferase